jgi:cysteine synthase
MNERLQKPSNTPLIELTTFGAEFGLKAKKILLKDESKNPFGTIKDRRNFYIFEEADRLKVDKIVLITSGNNGYSLAQFAKGSSVKVVCIVSKNLSPDIKHSLQQIAYQVIELNLEHKILRPEELIAFAREKEDEVIWEATNGYEEKYQDVVDEIIKEVTPDYIVVPVGSGGIFIGIVQGLERRGATTKVIGVGVQNTIQSFGDKLSTPWTPYAKALEHYQKNGHPIYRLSEDEVKKGYKQFKNITTCEPSSSIVFTAIHKHRFAPSDTIVFLNSGKAALS